MAAHPTELEAEESEAAPSGQVDGPTLLLVDRDLQSGQFLPESSVNGLQQPVMPAVGVHQNHPVPRTRGDEPTVNRLQAIRQVRSPHARG